MAVAVTVGVPVVVVVVIGRSCEGRVDGDGELGFVEHAADHLEEILFFGGEGRVGWADGC